MMVLSDGETFTDLDGCKIIKVSDDADPEYLDHMEEVVARFTDKTVKLQHLNVDLNIEGREDYVE